MSLLSHRRCRSWLASHFQRRLPPPQEKKMRRHLADCGQCRALYMVLSLAQHGGQQNASDRHQRLEVALFGPANGEARAVSVPRRVVTWAGVAAALVSMCVIGIQLLSSEPYGTRSAGESGWSATRTFVVKLAAPTNLSADVVSCRRINLSWTDNSGNEDRFRIYRDGAAVNTVGANVTTYQNTGLSGDTSYSYYVKAYKAGHESDPSNTVNVTTPACGTGICVPAETLA